MKTILLVWELGDGLGHAAPLVALARALDRRAEPAGGIRFVFAFRDPLHSRVLLDGEDWPILPAPQFTGETEASSYAASYSQLLAAIGFAKRSDLHAVVATWDSLFAVVKPDLIVADHSPSACLAARGRVPVLAIGSGFTLPPCEFAEYPALRRGMQPPAIQSLILRNVNELLKARGLSTLRHLPQLLKTEGRALFCLPHLDPYGPFRKDTFLGPYEPQTKARVIDQDAGVFFYGHSHLPDTAKIAEGLVQAAIPFHTFVNGQETAATEFLRQHAARYHDRPPPLARVFAECSIVVSHGGAGLAHAALAAGRAQIVLPIHVESQINGLRISAMGTGLVADSPNPADIRRAVGTVAEVRHFHEKAGQIADGIGQLRLPRSPIETAANQSLKLLA